MFLIAFILFNIFFALLILIFNRLTVGICKNSKHLYGNVVIITGGNAGIGYETAKNLAERGARVILGCRNDQRGKTARDKIVAETGNEDVHFHKLDLASFKSVRAFANNILQTEKRLDILINNAGVYLTDNVNTEDNLNLGMQANHFGPFLLTCLLLPLLKTSAPSRIINVSSMLHSDAQLDLDNLNFEKDTKETYNYKRVYANSKLCNILMTVELTRQLKGTRVTANSLHPGIVNTDMMTAFPLFYWLQPLLKCLFKSAWEGAQTTIYLAVSPEVEDVSGNYYSDCRQKLPSRLARDTDLAYKLWKISEKLVKVT